MNGSTCILCTFVIIFVIMPADKQIGRKIGQLIVILCHNQVCEKFVYSFQRVTVNVEDVMNIIMVTILFIPPCTFVWFGTSVQMCAKTAPTCLKSKLIKWF